MSAQTTERKAGRKAVVVLASGRGSNFRSLCEARARGRLPADIKALLTNVEGAGACDVAREFGIPVVTVPSKGLGREEHEQRVLAELARLEFDWIVLAGYMRLFSESFIRRFWDERLQAARILNVHPSLLPAFPGKDGYAQALSHGVKLTGATVHLVGAGLDDGPIVAQATLAVRDDDTVATLERRGLEVEHALYAEALRELVELPWAVKPHPEAGGRPRVVFDRREHA